VWLLAGSTRFLHVLLQIRRYSEDKVFSYNFYQIVRTGCSRWPSLPPQKGEFDALDSKETVGLHLPFLNVLQESIHGLSTLSQHVLIFVYVHRYTPKSYSIPEGTRYQNGICPTVDLTVQDTSDVIALQGIATNQHSLSVWLDISLNQHIDVTDNLLHLLWSFLSYSLPTLLSVMDRSAGESRQEPVVILYLPLLSVLHVAWVERGED